MESGIQSCFENFIDNLNSDRSNGAMHHPNLNITNENEFNIFNGGNPNIFEVDDILAPDEEFSSLSSTSENHLSRNMGEYQFIPNWSESIDIGYINAESDLGNILDSHDDYKMNLNDDVFINSSEILLPDVKGNFLMDTIPDISEVEEQIFLDDVHQSEIQPNDIFVPLDGESLQKELIVKLTNNVPPPNTAADFELSETHREQPSQDGCNTAEVKKVDAIPGSQSVCIDGKDISLPTGSIVLAVVNSMGSLVPMDKKDLDQMPPLIDPQLVESFHAQEEEEVDIETVSSETPVLEACDLVTLLAQFEASEKFNREINAEVQTVEEQVSLKRNVNEEPLMPPTPVAIEDVVTEEVKESCSSPQLSEAEENTKLVIKVRKVSSNQKSKSLVERRNLMMKKKLMAQQRIKDALPLEILEKIRSSGKRSSTKILNEVLLPKGVKKRMKKFKKMNNLVNKSLVNKNKNKSKSPAKNEELEQSFIQDHDYCISPKKPEKTGSKTPDQSLLYTKLPDYCTPGKIELKDIEKIPKVIVKEESHDSLYTKLPDYMTDIGNATPKDDPDEKPKTKKKLNLSEYRMRVGSENSRSSSPAMLEDSKQQMKRELSPITLPPVTLPPDLNKKKESQHKHTSKSQAKKNIPRAAKVPIRTKTVPIPKRKEPTTYSPPPISYTPPKKRSSHSKHEQVKSSSSNRLVVKSLSKLTYSKPEQLKYNVPKFEPTKHNITITKYEKSKSVVVKTSPITIPVYDVETPLKSPRKRSVESHKSSSSSLSTYSSSSKSVTPRQSWQEELSPVKKALAALPKMPTNSLGHSLLQSKERSHMVPSSSTSSLASEPASPLECRKRPRSYHSRSRSPRRRSHRKNRRKSRRSRSCSSSSSSSSGSNSDSSSSSSFYSSRSRSRSYSKSYVSRSRSRSSRRRSSHYRKRSRESYRSERQYEYDDRSRPPREYRYGHRQEPHLATQYMSNCRNIEDVERDVDERKIIYVGAIEDGTTSADLRHRFMKFGPIIDVNIHFRERGDNYGFVTFQYSDSAFSAIERTNDPNLAFGGRRNFCKVKYSDLDAQDDYDYYYKTPSSMDYDSLLQAALHSSSRR